MSHLPVIHTDEDNDDLPVGKLLNRREMLRVLGGVSATMLASAAFARGIFAQTATPTPMPTGAELLATETLPACVAQPELTEGPYFVDEMLNRSDIRVEPSDESIKEGVNFQLTFRVSQISVGVCSALEGAQVDVWHCDAGGNYSGVEDQEGLSYLRGYQLTDADGIAKFITIFPGWYQGRTTHIHFKIRTTDGYEFTSQLFFEDEFSDMIAEISPYSERGIPSDHNDGDGIFQGSQGLLTLNMVEEGEDSELGGYSAFFDIGLDLDAVTQAESGTNTMGSGGGGGNRPPRPTGTPGT
jgi:protocatechuate 3,4-dioxygenase beta subunit